MGISEALEGRRGLLALLAAAAVLGLWSWSGRPVSHPPGILVPEDPVQEPPLNPASWEHRHHRFTPLADFRVRARVLSVERYRLDASARLSPVDFALGWGPMSDSAVIDHLSITQSGRWYHYTWRGDPPIPLDQIISHSANMHLIPSSPSVRQTLLKVREGEVVDLQGKLVQVHGRDGFTWVSSTSRADSGEGSCEVVWVESATRGR